MMTTTLESNHPRYSTSSLESLLNSLIAYFSARELRRFYRFFKADLPIFNCPQDASQGNDKRMPLFIQARTTKDPNVIHFLMSLKPNIQALDAQNRNALHWAVAENCIQAAAMYLHYGVDAETRTKPHNHCPADRIQTKEMKQVFEDFKEMSKQDFAVKYQFNEQEPKFIVNIETFPFLELPNELQLEILKQTSIDTAFMAQFVCKKWRDYSLQKSFNPAISILGNHQGRDTAEDLYTLSVKIYPTVFHFCLEHNLRLSYPAAVYSVGHSVSKSICYQVETFCALIDGVITWDSSLDVDQLIRYIETSIKEVTLDSYLLEVNKSSQALAPGDISLFFEHSEHCGVGILFRLKQKA